MTSSNCPFVIGDRVRLARGWTVMCVIAIEDGYVRAKYANKEYNPVTREDFEDPAFAESCYTRHYTGFVAWDGNPNEGYIEMPKLNFKTPDGNLVSIRGNNKDGAKICEFEDGSVGVFQISELTEIIPYTIGVKNIYGSSYDVQVADDSGFVRGDVLVADNGELYTVVRLDTRSKRTKPIKFLSKLLVEYL